MKNLIKHILSFFYFLSRKSAFIEVKVEGNLYSNIFFGYYDVSPFSFDDSKLLLHGERENNIIDVLLYDLKSKTHKVLDSTLAWNYQQGARLMWFSEDTVIYNKYDIDSNLYYAILKNIINSNETKLDLPIQAVFKDEYMLSLDYFELNQLKTEYGYQMVSEPFRFGKIFRYDFGSAEISLLFEFEDCSQLLNGTYPELRDIHVNHFLINPTGDYFIFIFRFYCKENRVDSLMGYNFREHKLELLIEGEIISHCTWKSDTSVLLWGILNGRKGYFDFNRLSKKIQCVFSSERDGHPTMISTNSFISDTYPNVFSSQKLFIYNIDNHVETVLAETKHPVWYDKDKRCDLHPSLSRNKDFVQVDYMDKNRRKVGILKLER